jgi:hypothetical protein
MSRTGSKEKIRQFLLSNIGRVIESHELQAAADGAVQYSRRLRELRDEEGWPILSHNDSADLKPGQYLLRERPPESVRPQFAVGGRRSMQPAARDDSNLQRLGSIIGP